MYYLSRHAALVPAEAPCLAARDEKYEWQYGMQKHKKAVSKAKSAVDQCQPHSIDPAAQRIQAYSRNFNEDLKRTEIGRENRKLVERLASIANGDLAPDPRAPPPRSSFQPQSQAAPVGLLQQFGCVKGGGAANIGFPSIVERPRSLHATGRLETQRCIDQDNEALVHRIIGARTSFRRGDQRRDYDKHKRTVHLLQRLPSEPVSSRRVRAHRGTLSLPALRPLPRLVNQATFSTRNQVRGLEGLLLPGDLLPPASRPVSVGRQTPNSDEPGERSLGAQHRRHTEPDEPPRPEAELNTTLRTSEMEYTDTFEHTFEDASATVEDTSVDSP